MSLGVINRVNYMAKKKNATKGFKFGDCQNIIDHAISTEVDYLSEKIIPSTDTGNLE